MRDDRKLIRVSQAARVLDYESGTVRRKIYDGEIPFVKVGNGRLRIPVAALDALVAGRDPWAAVREAAEPEQTRQVVAYAG